MTTNSIITALVAGLILGAWLAQENQPDPAQAFCPPASSIRQLSPHEKPSRPMPAVAPTQRQVAERFWL